MTAKRIDGKAKAEQLAESITEQTAALVAEHGIKPGLAVVIIGEDPASQVYVRNKKRRAEACGFHSIQHSLAEDAQGVLEANAEMERVIGIIRTLKPEQQEVINMASWLGMSHGAIAEQTGIPLGTVKSYVTRGLGTIRQVLGEPELAGKATP